MTLTNIGIYLLNPSLVLVGIGEEYVIQLILKRMIFLQLFLHLCTLLYSMPYRDKQKRGFRKDGAQIWDDNNDIAPT